MDIYSYITQKWDNVPNHRLEATIADYAKRLSDVLSTDDAIQFPALSKEEILIKKQKGMEVLSFELKVIAGRIKRSSYPGI